MGAWESVPEPSISQSINNIWTEEPQDYLKKTVWKSVFKLCHCSMNILGHVLKVPVRTSNTYEDFILIWSLTILLLSFILSNCFSSLTSSISLYCFYCFHLSVLLSLLSLFYSLQSCTSLQMFAYVYCCFLELLFCLYFTAVFYSAALIHIPYLF